MYFPNSSAYCSLLFTVSQCDTNHSTILVLFLLKILGVFLHLCLTLSFLSISLQVDAEFRQLFFNHSNVGVSEGWWWFIFVPDFISIRLQNVTVFPVGPCPIKKISENYSKNLVVIIHIIGFCCLFFLAIFYYICFCNCGFICSYMLMYFWLIKGGNMSDLGAS